MMRTGKMCIKTIANDPGAEELCLSEMWTDRAQQALPLHVTRTKRIWILTNEGDLLQPPYTLDWTEHESLGDMLLCRHGNNLLLVRAPIIGIAPGSAPVLAALSGIDTRD